MVRKIFYIALITLMTVRLFPQTIDGVKVNLASINHENKILVLRITNNSGRNVLLRDESDIILAIDNSMRQSYGSFMGENEMLKKLGLTQPYRYEGILKTGSQKTVYIFFDERSNIQLDKIKTIIYHFNGLKFRLI